MNAAATTKSKSTTSTKVKAKADETKAPADASKDVVADDAQTEPGLTDEQRQDAAQAAAENAEQLGAANAVAQAAGIVNQERQATALGERQAAISVGNDPETADDEGGKEHADGPFEGQLHASDHYAVATVVVSGRQVVQIIPAGWVGPAPIEVPASRVAEVKRLLSKVKNLPEQDTDSTK